MKRLLAILVAFVILLTGACTQGEANPEPPEIKYGEDICIECSMIITDARYAAGYSYEVSPGRFESKAFDDIGGMLVHAEKNSQDKVTTWYVHDYDSEEWLDASEATFVMSPELPTPMGYGILAYADEAAAESAAEEVGGMLLGWEELRAADVGQGHGG